MSREIKFRGLRTDGKGWVYGVPFYISGERKCFIIDNCQSLHLTQEDSVFNGKEVKYRSVGQFTGLKDKNGVEIYEGDWLHITGYACYVIFVDGGFHTVYNHPEDGEILPIINVNVQLMTVTGNIHSNE